MIGWFSTAVIVAFRSLLFRLVAPSVARLCVVLLLLCLLILGIHASGISIPLSLLMLLGRRLHRRDWKTYARQNKRARPTHPASPYPDLRRFRARSQHRTLSALGRGKRFIYRDPHWYTRRIKEAIHIRLHPNNINRDSEIYYIIFHYYYLLFFFWLLEPV